jgi:hypothetical protein
MYDDDDDGRHNIHFWLKKSNRAVRSFDFKGG